MLDINPTILQGSWIKLEPMNKSHKKELYNAAQDQTIWVFNGSKAYGEKFYPWFEKALKAFKLGQHLPFVVRRLTDNKIIGSTRYYDINSEHHRLTIGYTWYIPEVWGSYVNPECKLLLLKFAFNELQVNRIEFLIDKRNAHSGAALKKLGATEEGLLRHHMILENEVIRDTIVFSIIKPDWPQIQLALQSRLENYGYYA